MGVYFELIGNSSSGEFFKSETRPAIYRSLIKRQQEEPWMHAVLLFCQVYRIFRRCSMVVIQIDKVSPFSVCI